MRRTDQEGVPPSQIDAWGLLQAEAWREVVVLNERAHSHESIVVCYTSSRPELDNPATVVTATIRLRDQDDLPVGLSTAAQSAIVHTPSAGDRQARESLSTEMGDALTASTWPLRELAVSGIASLPAHFRCFASGRSAAVLSLGDAGYLGVCTDRVEIGGLLFGRITLSE